MHAFALPAAVGFVGLAVTVLIGFEEANGLMLLVSALLLLATPLAALGHVACRRDLTSDQKRVWLRALTGRRALRAWSAYLSSPRPGKRRSQP